MSNANALSNSAKQFAKEKRISYIEIKELLDELDKDLLVYDGVDNLIEGLIGFQQILRKYRNDLVTHIACLKEEQNGTEA